MSYVCLVFSPVFQLFFHYFWRIRFRNGYEKRKRHLCRIDAFQCVAEYIRQCRSHWMSALLNQHHVAPQAKCIVVCVSGRLYVGVLFAITQSCCCCCCFAASYVLCKLRQRNYIQWAHPIYSTAIECPHAHTHAHANEWVHRYCPCLHVSTMNINVFVCKFTFIWDGVQINEEQTKKNSAFGIEIG